MRPRILLAFHQPGWCFERIARTLARYLSDEFEFEVRQAGEQGGRFDLAVAFWWPTVHTIRATVQAERVLLCIYDHGSWQPSPVRPHARQFHRALEVSDAIAVGNQRLAAQVPRSKPVFVVEDGVETSLFTPQPLPAQFSVGWCGDTASGAGDPKGLGLIRRACELASVPLVIADRRTSPTPHEAMPTWYSGISLYCCASEAEGTPNPVLEALACGRPVISTDVGIVPRVVSPACGRIVARTPDAIAVAIRELQQADLAAMGRAARAAVEPWDWARKAEAWRTCLRGVLS